MNKIYDAFLFFNELDLLEIRLTILYPYVDYFVISECDYTFAGNKKPFYFEENKERYSKFLDKIIHIKNCNSYDTNTLENVQIGKRRDVYDDIINGYRKIQFTPQTDGGKGNWCRDYLHREYTKLGLSECDDDDIIMYSDTDEFPHPEIVKNLRSYDMNKLYCLYQDNNNFFVNNMASTNWKGNIISYYKTIKQRSLNEMRVSSRKSNATGFEFVKNGGWHLSFLGGAEAVKTKIKNYGHQEYNNSSILSNVEENIKQNKDLFFRRPGADSVETFYFDNMKVVDINGYFPKEMTDLINEKFSHFIKKI